MVNQTPISYRMDTNLKDAVDAICKRTGLKRNDVINQAVRCWLKLDRLNDLYRQESLIGSSDKRMFCNEHLTYRHLELPDFLRFEQLK